MARFEALSELHDDSLTLPVKGGDGRVREYTIPAPSAEVGLKVQQLTGMAVGLLAGGAEPDTSALDDAGELDLYKMCLGDVHEQLLKDGVTWPWHRHVAITAVRWILDGLDAAAEYWKAAGDPTQVAGPNREARRAAAKAKKKTKSKSGSAAANGTRRPASTSGTSARKATSTTETAAEVSSQT